MKKLTLIIVLCLSTLSFSDEFDLIVSTGVMSSATAGLGLQLEVLPEHDLVLIADAGVTPFFGEFVGGAIKLENINGIRYGVFYKRFTTFDRLWSEYYFDALFDSFEDDDPDIDNAVYDIYGIAVSKVFDHDEFISPFLGLEVGYGEVQDKDEWEGEDGKRYVEYYDFRIGFAF